MISSFKPSRPDYGRREKINLNLYFHTSLWCLKRFYEGLKGLRKTFSCNICVKTKIKIIYFNTTLWNARSGKGQTKHCHCYYVTKTTITTTATTSNYKRLNNKNLRYFYICKAWKFFVKINVCIVCKSRFLKIYGTARWGLRSNLLSQTYITRKKIISFLPGLFISTKESFRGK